MTTLVPAENQTPSSVLSTTRQRAPISVVGEAINRCGNTGSISIVVEIRQGKSVEGLGGWHSGTFSEEVTSDLNGERMAPHGDPGEEG